jgi:hypothetical protein
MTRQTNSKPDSAEVFTYTNREGQTYYLHEGRTKTGKPRYFFAKTVREGALAEMPEGFEASESLNAVVSVRRKGKHRSTISDADLKRVRDEVRRHAHLRAHEVRAERDAIIVHEPGPGRRYFPVMRFEQGIGGYSVHRMTYSGHGGWSYPLDIGDLDALASEYVRHIGTDEFFELF